jgi:transposase
MPSRLRAEEVVTIQVLAEKGASSCAIARQLGVSEGTVRYHLRRAAAGAEDGRKRQVRRAAACHEAIGQWIEAHGGARPANVRELYEHLQTEHAYGGSYNSVRRYVRERYGVPRIRTYRRIETPPGAQTQTDWGEYPRMRVGGELVELYAFVMVLSHSRKLSVVWSPSCDLVSWLACHNGAYRRFGGVAAVNRIDNVKTAIITGAGAWGTIHPTYRAYARSVGFHIDACAPREPQSKGKVEAKVKLSRQLVDPTRNYDSLEELQTQTDERIARWAKRVKCSATGNTVEASFEAEQPYLAPLPILPEPFDVALTRRVQRDCLVRFEGREYAVPFAYVDREVEVRGCAQTVQILADGQILRTYPRRTEARVLLDPECYEGPSTERVQAPPPLGRMGKRLAELAAMPVERRPLDLYAALAEVAR